MKNSEMIAGRFARLHESRKKLAWILAHLEAGRAVLVVTYTKATRYTAKHAGMFKATKSGLYVQHGQRFLCIDGCALRAEAR